jgi:hypothetical protein
MKTKLFPIIYIGTILFIVTDCKKEEPVKLSDESTLCLGQVPTVTVQSATNIAPSTATLHGTVNSNCLSTTVSFEYGTTASYGNTFPASQNPITGDSISHVSLDIFALTSGTTYHFRIKAGNSKGTVYSSDKTFTTSICGQGIAVTTLPATNIELTTVNMHGTYVTLTTLTLNGTVNTNGLPTTVSFYYGYAPGARLGTKMAAVQSPVTVSNTTNVSLDISYTLGMGRYFRVEATNACGAAFGNSMKFTIPR